MTKKKATTQKQRRIITRLLTTKPINLHFKEYLQLEEWLSVNDEMEELYQALQGIRRVYSRWDQHLTKKTFKAWVERYLFSKNRVVHRIAKTLLQWEKAILNAIKYSVSNGPIEGLNNKTKLIKRRAYGYRNLVHFEKRLQIETALIINN
ncbi:transposase [Bacillus sp. 2205SS5-2]|uniref:transposase n=1 Tax=Bacillus sp. 2205SS5-2 TaxID=3109031 RepID=UPI00300792DB